MDIDLSKHGVRPLIFEILRTGHLFPKLRLCVEHLQIQQLEPTEDGQPRGGYRLYLTDGEYRIQGLTIRCSTERG